MPIEDWHSLQFIPINIGKVRFVDFIEESTSVSVKFTFESSITEMPTLLIIVAQDTKFGEYIALRCLFSRENLN